MSSRIKKTWKVLHSYENDTAELCVDLFIREDGSYGYEEFRRDPEDLGAWTGLKYYSVKSFSTKAEVFGAIEKNIAWYVEKLNPQ